MEPEELIKLIDGIEDEITRHEVLRDQISYHSFERPLYLEGLNFFIDRGQKVVDSINANDGYAYLENVKSKISENLPVLEEYRDFIKDSNTSIMNLYSRLEERISQLKHERQNYANQYNATLGVHEFYKRR